VLSSQLTSSYEVSCYTDAIVSIRYSIFHYGAGAAHPNHVTAVMNAQLRPMFPLALADLFKGKSAYLKTISNFCISSLAEAKGLAQPSDWILRGAGSDLQNFSRFNVTPLGLLITFDEYQVDCYAAGGSQVLIPKGLLTEYLNPACAVVKSWAGRE